MTIEYNNGDRFRHQFRDLTDEDDLRSRYPDLLGSRGIPEAIRFPLTLVEISERAQDSELDFDERKARIQRATIRGSWSINNRVGVHWGVPPDYEARLFFGSPGH